MRINIDLNNKIGKIKDMNATGQTPMGGGVGYEAYKNLHLLSDVLVPYVRLHDVGGGFGGNRYVDIPNILLEEAESDKLTNEYFIEFNTHGMSQSPTIALPNNIKWLNGEIPTFEIGYTYQLSVSKCRISLLHHSLSFRSQVIFQYLQFPV